MGGAPLCAAYAPWHPRAKWKGGGEEYDICEGDAWEFQSAVEEDMEGGHSAFPLLDPHSDLAERLTKLYMEVV